jgi:hypothetical protein
MSQSNRLLPVFLLAFLIPASAALAQADDVHLYNENVVGRVNVGVFVESGEIVMPDGSVGKLSAMNRELSSQSSVYDQVQVWEKDIERLGAKSFEPDGIWLVNFGGFWFKKRVTLVLWEIQIPNASSRSPSEFDEDITLSLWADWNQDLMWDKGERVINDHISLRHCFPTSKQTLRVYYLTLFVVPDLDSMDLGKTPGDPEDQWIKKGTVNIWVRGIVSYDDPDVSPDGSQIFGEVEDYRVSYRKTSGYRR